MRNGSKFLKTLLISGASTISLIIGTPALANPAGGNVVAGASTIAGEGTKNVVITQTSDKSVIDWTSFSIDKDETTTFNQINQNAISLNRVTGNQISNILGTLEANGQVYLINPNGIVFGKTAKIDVAGLVATTADIKNEDFLNSNYRFGIAGNADAKIVNEGTINVKDAGIAAFVAPQFENSGIINAKLGKVAIAGANKFTLDLAGDSLIKFELGDEVTQSIFNSDGTSDALVTVNGIINATGGSVNITALSARDVINQSVNIGSTKISDGFVINSDGTYSFTDTSSVSLADSGSTLTDGNTSINAANIDVSGNTINVASGAVLDASATEANGNGGNIKIIADMDYGNLVFNGTALAKGGSVSGDGGFIETSGASVDFSGAKIDTSATDGATGEWLVDPYDITIDSAAASTISSNLETTNVTIQTTANGTSSPAGTVSEGYGDINITADIAWGSSNTLTLDAYHSININAAIDVNGAGKVNLITNNGGTGGDYDFGLTSDGFSGNISFNAAEGSGQALTINGTNYTLIYSLDDLTSSGNIALAKSISPTTAYDGNVVSGNFTGNFTGLGNTIDGLTFNVSNSYYEYGLFRYIQSGATVRDLIISNVSAETSDSIYDFYYGTVSIYNYGTIKNVMTSGDVTIPNSFSGYSIGGITGYNYSTITNAISKVNINIPYAYVIGGIAGENQGTINKAVNYGNIIGEGYIGGIVGYLYYDSISNTINYGAISGNDVIGGIVGYSQFGSTASSINYGYVSGSISGGAVIGYNGGSITNSYYDSETSGATDSNSGVTAKTTAELQSGTLLDGLDSSIWGATDGYYQYLMLNKPANNKISGYAYNADGSVASGASVGVYYAGSLLNSVYVITGANGYYYYVVPKNTVTTGTGIGAILDLDGDSGMDGAVYSDTYSLSKSGDLSNLNVYAGQFNYYTSLTSLSSLDSSLSAVFGSSYNSLIAATGQLDQNYYFNNDFTIDSDLDKDGSIYLQTDGTITIADGASVTSDASDDAVVINAAILINNAGANAISALNGRFIAYLNDWDTSSLGGLRGSNLYNRTYANNAPGTLSSYSGNLFVYNRQPTLTINANDTSREYGVSNPVFEYTVTGLVNGDTASYAITGTPSLTTDATIISNVGSYTITTSIGTADSDVGYNISLANGALSITKAMLTVTPDDQTREYGLANPELTGVVTGYRNNDTSSVITGLTYNTVATIGSNVGTYDITASGATATNYNFTYNTGALSITKAMLTVTPDDQTREYGLANPELTGVVSGFRNSDTLSVVSGLTYNTIATTGSNVGTYDITASGATATNYNFSYNTGALSITKAMLTVTPDDQTREYGLANPELTGVITGYRNSDDASVINGLTYNTIATTGSNVGTYDITASGATSTNYNFTYNTGVLSITKAMLTVTPDDQTREYGLANPELTGVVSGFRNSDTLSVVSGLTYNTIATTGSNVGTYDITASGATATNYNFTYNKGLLTVNSNNQNTPSGVAAVGENIEQVNSYSNPSNPSVNNYNQPIVETYEKSNDNNVFVKVNIEAAYVSQPMIR